MVNAQQAKLNKNYKNTRLTLLKTNAAIWFNFVNVFKMTLARNNVAP